MPAAPALHLGVARSVDEQFLELMHGDEQLLRAEFDKIVAREWPTGHLPPAHQDDAGNRPSASAATGDGRCAGVASPTAASRRPTVATATLTSAPQPDRAPQPEPLNDKE